MQRFKDIHKGKRIWIMGGGVSLLDIDFEKIPEDDIIIATNSSVLRQDRFDYACFTDGSIYYFKFYRDLANHPCTVISFNEQEVPAIKGDTYFVKKSYEKRGTASEAIFTNQDNEVCFGIDIIHCTTHLAYIMGAREIILCGCDCYSSEHGKHHWFTDVPELTADCPDVLNYSYSRDIGKERSFGAELNYWQSIYDNNANLNIIIASPNSKIPGYPKVAFKDLIL